MRMETGGAGIGKLKERKTRDKVLAHGSGASRGPGKECGEEIQNAVAETLASASWRRDVGLSDCTVGGGVGRRPWNFHVNKISVRKRVYGASHVRESDAGHKKEREKEEEGRQEGGKRSERRSLYARVASCLDASPDVEIHPMVTT